MVLHWIWDQSCECRIQKGANATSSYLWHEWVITSHTIQWDIITHPCSRYPFLAQQFSYMNPRSWPSNDRCRIISQWASCQICKIAGCAYAGNAGNVFPATEFKGNRWLAIPACIPTRASRTCHDAVAEKTFPAFPAHAQPAILRIWQEAHDSLLADTLLAIKLNKILSQFNWLSLNSITLSLTRLHLAKAHNRTSGVKFS